MLIALSSEDFNPVGHVWIDARIDSVRVESSRRVTRRATLDGGAALVDMGFSDADRTLKLVWSPTGVAQVEQVRDLMHDAATVLVSLPDGCYRAAIERVNENPTSAQVTLLIMTKLSS